MEFFQVTGTAPAKDFRDLFAHGWYDAQEGIDAPCLVRPGPFIPRITMPSGSDLVVTDRMKGAMEAAGLGDLLFREVYKYHIPELHWEQWDKNQDVPESEWPDQEVEPWLLSLPHSPSASAELGTLWDIQLPFGASAQPTEEVKPRKYKLLIDPLTWTGSHFCTVGNPSGSPKHARWVVVSTTGREWIEEHARDWFEFEPCVIKP